MQYVLFFSLVGIFLITYYFTGKDLLFPMTVQILTFLFASSMCIFALTFIDYKLHIESISLIIFCMLMSVVIGSLVHSFFMRVRIQRKIKIDQAMSPISKITHTCVLMYIISMLFWRILVIRQLPGNASMMANFYQFSVVQRQIGEKALPFGLLQADHICEALFVIYGFNLINFGKQLSKGNFCTNLLVLGLCIFSRLLGAQRLAAVQNIITLIMIYHLLRIQKNGKYRAYSFKFIIRMVLVWSVILFVFVQLNAFVGRGELRVSPLRYLSGYAGAQIINLDIFLQNPGARSEFFGKYVFGGIASLLKNIGLIDFQPYSRDLEFHYIQGNSTGNTYSCFRAYYKDFGLMGTYILHFIFSVIFSCYYEYTRKELSNKHILLYSYMSVGCFLSFYAEYFFSRVLSIGYIENIILILAFYNLFICKRIRFTRNRESVIRRDQSL